MTPADRQALLSAVDLLQRLAEMVEDVSLERGMTPADVSKATGVRVSRLMSLVLDGDPFTTPVALLRWLAEEPTGPTDPTEEDDPRR